MRENSNIFRTWSSRIIARLEAEAHTKGGLITSVELTDFGNHSFILDIGFKCRFNNVSVELGDLKSLYYYLKGFEAMLNGLKEPK